MSRCKAGKEFLIGYCIECKENIYYTDVDFICINQIKGEFIHTYYDSLMAYYKNEMEP